ncbi:hypothetical protein TRIUR3_05696 [Triticum urartu]|uniref:Uncharacterized protein n=2 Tax=Triticum TaxID=4564 RepID=A0A9R0VVZ3_TRITD|nr:hypothetical protein TRIUR3_05696 [Triticum urartu]VAH89286.1 unnamed protein product [Triticum turgidum subsp. durum]
MQPLTLGLVAPVVTTEISLASSISDEVQAVAKGCAFAIDEGDTLHDLTELIKCLIAMPAITQGLIRLVKAEQTKHANQVVIYLAVQDFLQKRESEKFEREEAERQKEEARQKRAKARGKKRNRR